MSDPSAVPGSFGSGTLTVVEAEDSRPTIRPTIRPVLRRSAIVAALAALVAAVAVIPGDDRRVEAVSGGDLGAGGEFQSIEPVRVLDTRLPSAGDLFGRQASAATPGTAPEIVLPLDDPSFGLPSFTDVDRDGFDDNVLAVVVNITVVAPTRPGYLKAFGKGTPEGETSVVNFAAGEDTPNTAIIRLGRDASLSMRIVTWQGAGSADVVVDMTGWFSSSDYSTPGARTVTIPPVRIFDSHEPQFAPTPSGRSWQRTLDIRGAVDMFDTRRVVVPEEAVGVIVNVTGDNPVSPTYVSLLPDRVASSELVRTSNLNLYPGMTRANLSIMPLPADGQLTLFNYQGDVRLILDVVGYLIAADDPTSRTGRVVPLVAPFRAFDTRLPEHGSQQLPAAFAEDWSFDEFVADVKVDGVWVGAQQGLFGNLTATGLVRQAPWYPIAKTYLTAYPSPADGDRPFSSTLNLEEGEDVPNLVLLSYGPTTIDDDGTDVVVDNGVAVFNWSGYVHYLLDVYAVVLD